MPCACAPGGAGKAKSRNPVAYAAEKSDKSVVPEKLSNNGLDPAEVVEERDEFPKKSSHLRSWGMSAFMSWQC